MNERSIFLEALEITDPAERAAFLDRACNGNADMRKGVEGLLVVNDRSGTFMRGPVGGDATADLRPSEGPGTRVGPYKLLQQIGEGGMGVVYMAEQDEPVRRKVALKIIKPGMDSKQVVARFEAERQALSMMDHPNIARVLDAGTTDSGRPFFVMELVHGVPITTFCDDAKLTPRDRLALFVPVCQAIQHAHQKGIIHRDVKPSNVLVTMYDDKPVPKVIDFGVAKAVEQRLTEKTLFTQFGSLVGTFEYMSPEQAEMNAFGVDTRSDVYSLGVLLYELLTGSTPLERQRLREAALGEVIRLIKEEEAPRPSLRLSTSGTLAKVAAARKTEPGKLSALVRGELDWIVMRCLEKDRTRRYETASGLAKDVERYLKDEAVEACPPSAMYRLRKAYRKHRAAVVTSGAFAFLLAAGTFVSVTFAVRAMFAERDATDLRLRAERHLDETTALHAESVHERDEKRAALDRAERLLYASQITQAYTAARDLRTGLLLAGLADTRPAAGRPDLRGWDWHYLDRLAHSWTAERRLDVAGSGTLADPARPPRPNGDSEYFAFQFTADGSRLLVPPARRVAVPPPKGVSNWGPPGNVVDPSRVATEAAGAVIDLATGKVLRVIPLPAPGPIDPEDVRFSPDGLYMGFAEQLAADRYRPRVIEVATGRDVPMPIPPTSYYPIVQPAAGAARVVVYEERTSLAPGVVPPAGPVQVWDRGAAAARSLVVQTADQTADGERVNVLAAADGSTAAILRHWRLPAGGRPGRPDGPKAPKELADGSKRLEFWDLAADPPAQRATAPLASGGTGLMAFSANGKYLAIAAGARTIGVFDTVSGQKVWEGVTLESEADEDFGMFHSPAAVPLVSDDGRRLVVREREGVFRVIEPQSGPMGMGPTPFGPVPLRPALPGQRAPASRKFDLRGPVGGGRAARPGGAVWLAPDGSRLAAADGGVVGTWDLSRPPDYMAVWPRVLRVEETMCGVYPDARGRVAVAYGTGLKGGPGGGPVAVYDTVAGTIRHTLVVPDAVAHAEVSPDHRRLLLATRAAPGPAGGPAPMTWSLWSLDGPGGPAELVRFAAPPRDAWRAAELPRFTPDGRWLIEPIVDPTAAAPTKASAVVGFNLRRAMDGKIGWEQRYPAGERVGGPPVAGLDGTTLVVVTVTAAARTIHAYTVADGRPRWHLALTAGAAASPPAVRFSPDGSRVAVAQATTDRGVRIQVLDAATGAVVRTAAASNVRILQPVQLAFGTDGGLAVRENRQAIVWDGDSPEPAHRLVGHNGIVGQVLFSADGRRLFTLDQGSNIYSDRSIHVWDTATGRELLTFRVPTTPQLRRPGLVAGIDLSSEMWLDGERLCVRMADGVRVFDGTPRPEGKKDP